MGAPAGQNTLPAQTSNTSAPIATFGGDDVDGLYDSLGKPITGKIQSLMAYVTPSWRYFFGTFVTRSSAVSSYSDTASTTYDPTQLQKLMNQVTALSKVVGQ